MSRRGSGGGRNHVTLNRAAILSDNVGPSQTGDNVMTKRVIEHEIKLEKSVKIIIAALAFGLLAHEFLLAFSVKSAIADIAKGPLAVRLSGKVGLGGN